MFILISILSFYINQLNWLTDILSLLNLLMTFGKRNPINAGIMMAMELNINVSLFIIFRLYKKIVNEKIKLLAQ